MDENTSGAFDQEEYEAQQEEYEAQQDVLPPHKRDDYAEMMRDLADDFRKKLRENAE